MSAVQDGLQAVSGLVAPVEMAELLKVLGELAESAVEIEKVRAQREVALAKIREGHQTVRLAMVHLFAERRAVLDEHFRLIDAGVARGDDSLINLGLAGVSAVVGKSPFADLRALGDFIERGGRIVV